MTASVKLLNLFVAGAAVQKKLILMKGRRACINNYPA